MPLKSSDSSIELKSGNRIWQHIYRYDVIVKLVLYVLHYMSFIRTIPWSSPYVDINIHSRVVINFAKSSKLPSGFK